MKSLSTYTGKKHKVGDILGTQDNTGFSTGPHTHGQWRRVTKDLVNLDVNNANNSFDPQTIFSGIHAKEYAGIRAKLVEIRLKLQKLLDSIINI